MSTTTTLQTLKGFRDFLPSEKRVRDQVQSKIVEVFVKSGFEPLETPTLEYKETIMGKYGEEADKLVYEFADRGGREVAMRYDQTVPTARVMAQYQNELPLPFRRYQIQNVFRADKPQKGRYREFTQCDIDIYGSVSPLADAEILATTYAAYDNIGFRSLQLAVNDRQTLMSALQPFATDEVPVTSIIQSIDKLDKQTEDDVMDELRRKGLRATSALQAMKAVKGSEPSENLQKIMRLAQQLGVPQEVLVFTPTLARGLDYYTGLIFEISDPGYTGGSLGGGGRYDELIGQLSGVDMPAVGVGFGFDRTVEAALALGLVSAQQASAQVLVSVFDESLQEVSAQAVATLREAGVSALIYPDPEKLGKQLKFASRTSIPFVLIIGEQEQAEGVVTLRNMISGQQGTYTLEEVIDQVKR